MTKETCEPTVTIIVPTFRRTAKLKRALNAIQNQTYSNLKIFVSDDCSGDDTEQMVKEMEKVDPRIIYHCNEENLGPQKNYGNAVLKIDTPFFAFCADDDLYLPQHIEHAIDSFKAFPDAGFSINETITVDETGHISFVSTFDIKQGRYDSAAAIMLLLKKEPSFLTGSIIRKEVIDKVGGYNSDCGALCDRDFCFKAAAQFPFVITKKPGVIFCAHESNYFFNDMNKHQWQQWKKYYDNCTENIFLDAETRKVTEKHLYERLRGMLKNQGKQAILKKNYETARLCTETLQNYFKSTRYPLKLSLLKLSCIIFPPLRWYYSFTAKQRIKRKTLQANIRYKKYKKYKKYLTINPS